ERLPSEIDDDRDDRCEQRDGGAPRLVPTFFSPPPQDREQQPYRDHERRLARQHGDGRGEDRPSNATVAKQQERSKSKGYRDDLSRVEPERDQKAGRSGDEQPGEWESPRLSSKGGSGPTDKPKCDHVDR